MCCQPASQAAFFSPSSSAWRGDYAGDAEGRRKKKKKAKCRNQRNILTRLPHYFSLFHPIPPRDDEMRCIRRNR